MPTRRYLSPAGVVSVVAIVVALGGTAVAGSGATTTRGSRSDAKQDRKALSGFLNSTRPVAFGLVDTDGTVSNARGLTTANVTHPHPGVYCVSGLPFPVLGAQVTTQFNGDGGTTAQFTQGSTGNCPNGGQVLTWVINGNQMTDQPFQIFLYG